MNKFEGQQLTFDQGFIVQNDIHSRKWYVIRNGVVQSNYDNKLDARLYVLRELNKNLIAKMEHEGVTIEFNLVNSNDNVGWLVSLDANGRYHNEQGPAIVRFPQKEFPDALDLYRKQYFWHGKSVTRKEFDRLKMETNFKNKLVSLVNE